MDHSFSYPNADGHTMIIVGKDIAGRHYVSDNHGHVVDTFESHEEAVRFALLERSHQPGAIVMITPAPAGHL